MQRRYEVYIEGKPVVIDGAPPMSELPVQWLAFRVDDHAEVERALELLNRPGVRGIQLYGNNGTSAWDLFRAGYTFVQAAGGMVLDEEGRLLAIRRLGKWDLPKGKVDPDEGITQAAIREVREECGALDLEMIRPLTATWHTYPHKGRHYLKCTEWFLLRSSSSASLEPEQAEGIEEVRWLNEIDVERMRADTYASLLPLLALWETLPERHPD